MIENPRIEECIENFKRGQDTEENFRIIFEEFSPQIHRFLLRKSISREICEELTQETFLSVYKGLGTFRNDAPFKNWLFAIARNVYLRHIERINAEKRKGEETPLAEENSDPDDQRKPVRKLVDPGLSPSEELLEKEKRDLVRAALLELPEQQRRCAQLRVLHDLSYQEIADEMGISVNTVKAHLFQAKETLREILSPYFGDFEF